MRAKRAEEKKADAESKHQKGKTTQKLASYAKVDKKELTHERLEEYIKTISDTNYVGTTLTLFRTQLFRTQTGTL